MNTQTFVQPFEFSALSLVGQALRLLWENLWLFLWWCLPPIAVSVVASWRGELFSGHPVVPGEQWAWVLGLAALEIWLVAVAFIRAMRFTVLGERPQRWMVIQLFEARTWRYILVSLWIMLQIVLVGAFAAGIPCVAVYMAALEKGIFSNETQRLWFLFTEGSFLSFFGACVIVVRVLLYAPNIAMNGKLRLSQLGGRSASATRAMVRTYLLAYVVPSLFFGIYLTLIVLGIVSVGSNLATYTKVCSSVNVVFYLFQVVVCSLVYQRLLPLLEREEPARKSGSAVAEGEASPTPAAAPGEPAVS